MGRDIAPTPYNGPHVFINSTADKLNKSRDEIFTISSHVSKTHRKWVKDERLKRLNASAGKAVAQRNIVAAAPTPQTVGPRPIASLYHPAVSTSTDASRRQWPLSQEQAWPPLPGARSDANSSSEIVRYSRALLSGERSQENADQERTRAWEEYRYWALEQPSLTLWKGNSDPFQSAAVGLVARDYEIIRQAQRFPVFAAWPDKASAVFRAPIADTANSHIELQQAMKDEGEIHAILASGYHVTAGSSGPNSEVYLGRELAHKTRAVALLRQKLLDHGFSDSVATLIRLLISLDFEAGDFTASLVHLRGLWSMSSSLPDRLLDTQELIIVSDVWVGLSLLKKPEIPPSRYDPGSRPLQTFDAALRLLEESEATRFNCYEAETSYRSDTVLSTESFSLLDAANEVVNTKAIMDQVNEATIQQDVVWWMHRRATAVSGLLISGYVDAIRSSGSAICSDNLNVRKELDAAACLCGILFMNFRFMDSPNNYNFSKTFQMIEPILRRVSQDSGEGVQQEQDDVFLWLLFMCAMGSDVYAARGDIPYSVWPAREFRRVCARRKVTDEASIITLFRQFEYYPQMDDFVKELLSDTVELLDMPIMPWSKWCEILDHYVP